jgi:hypothetical protein
MRRSASREGLKRSRTALRGPPGPGPDARQASALGTRQMVLGLLLRQWLSASRADGARAARPMGPRCFKRHAAPIRPLLEMRSQRRGLDASKLG